MQETVTDFSQQELEKLLMLQAWIQNDYLTPRDKKCAMVYVFAQTDDNRMGVLERVSEMAKQGKTHTIGLCDGETAHGYSGFEAWADVLRSYGVGSVPIIRIKAKGNVNTRTEASALVNYCAGVRGDLCVVAPAFHLLRAFITTITELQKSEECMRIFAASGTEASWVERVRHSQGVVVGTRYELLISELGRIAKYRAPEFGGMATAEEVIAYLHYRDSK